MGAHAIFTLFFWLQIVTADHGNCEVMVDPHTGEPHTAHTTNLVPVVLVRCFCSNMRAVTRGTLLTMQALSLVAGAIWTA